MTNKILAILLSSFLTLAVPATVSAASSIEIIDNDVQSIAISVTETSLHVTGANGQMLYVYNVAGVRLMSVKIEGQDKKIDINLPKGCYIVKVGKVVRKIYIK